MEVPMRFKFWGKKKTVRAREFILEDAEGRERAALRMDGANNTLIHFRGPEGQTRCFMGVTDNGTPRIALLYANGKGMIELEASDSLNTAAVIIAGPNGKAKVVLALTNCEVPTIVLYDEHGKPAWMEHAVNEPEATSPLSGDYPDWDSFLRD
jgi:hypothetical protein